jgi:uncharacterized BrkB/YihY/UPF0761 family membrane protein
MVEAQKPRLVQNFKRRDMKKSLTVILFLAFMVFANITIHAFPTPLKWPTNTQVERNSGKEGENILPVVTILGWLFWICYPWHPSNKAKEQE